MIFCSQSWSSWSCAEGAKTRNGKIINDDHDHDDDNGNNDNNTTGVKLNKKTYIIQTIQIYLIPPA